MMIDVPRLAQFAFKWKHIPTGCYLMEPWKVGAAWLFAANRIMIVHCDASVRRKEGGASCSAQPHPNECHWTHRYLTQLLVPALKRGGPSRLVWVSSPSETNTPDIDFDNLECVAVLNLCMFCTSRRCVQMKRWVFRGLPGRYVFVFPRGKVLPHCIGIGQHIFEATV